MKRILSILLAVMLVMALAVPAMAENKYQDQQSPDNLVDVKGDNTSAVFNKYFITRQGTVVPTVEFAFTVEAGTAIPATDGTAEKWTYNSTDYATQPEAEAAALAAIVHETDPTEKWIFNGTDYTTEAEAQEEARAAVTHVAATSGTFEVLAPTITGTTANSSALPVFKGGDNKANFSDSVTKYTAKQTGDTVHLDTNEQYQKEQITLDFSNVTFYEPGVYRYLVKETKPATPNLSGIIYDSQEVATAGTGSPKAIPDATTSKSVPVEGSKERTLDVYVTDNGSGTLVVSAYVLHEGSEAPVTNGDMGTADVAAAANRLPDKSDGFVNEYQTVDLAFAKEVTGNQGSRDKYFKFTVTVPDAVYGQNYIVSFANDNNDKTNDGNADATSGTNAATVAANAGKNNYDAVSEGIYTVTGANLIAGKAFYLQSGQHIVIRGLPAGSAYTVAEDAEDYKSTAQAVTLNSVDYKNLTTGTLSTQDAKSDSDGTTAATADDIVRTSFQNTRAGIIPTGVAIGFGGAAVLLALAAVYFVLRKKLSVTD